jgi:hypothetical protein
MMKVHPSTISRIFHHAIRGPLTAPTEDVADPVEWLVAIGADEDEVVVAVVVAVVEVGNTCTKSERQTPKSGITSDDPVQFAGTHNPARRT